MTNRMTEGKPLKLILTFALPLLGGNLFQQLYNIADAAIVGKFLGSNALASVGASSSIQFLVLGFCIGTSCGFAIPVAQRFGAKDLKEMRSFIFHSYLMTSFIAIFLTTTCALLCHQILHILRTPENIYKNAYLYLLILFLGIPFNLLYNLLAGILRAIGDSKTPFLLLVASTILNIGLDLLFILVLHFGCAGAAIATITAQGISGILCLIVIIKRFPIIKLKRSDCVYQNRKIVTLAAMGIPMGLQYSITAIGSMVMQSANNGLGSVYVSGFTAAMRIKQFAMSPFDALATAVSTFVSQNYGAVRFDRIKQGIRQGITIGVSYGLAIGIVLILFGRTLSMLFIPLSDVEVLDAAGKYLRCLGFFYWSLGILNVCRMCVQGLGFSGRTILSGTMEMIARIIVSVFFVPIFGFNAICFADQSAWLSGTFYIIPVCIYSIKKLQQNTKQTDIRR